MKNFYVFIFLLLSFTDFHAQNEDTMEKDWPNLKKYEKENQKIISAGKKPTAVFMGNSITEGWKNARPSFFSENNFVGRGIGGQTTPQMLIRFTPDVLDLQPKAVVILAGTNDIAGNTGPATLKMITDNIKTMAQLAKANNIKVILTSILPVSDYPWQPGLEPVPKIAEINTWLEQYAQDNGHTYVDYFPVLANDEHGMKAEFAEDGVHPNKKAYQLMEPLVMEGIQKALEKN